MYSLGLDIGYSSIKVSLVKENNQVEYIKYKLHKGQVKQCLKQLLEEISPQFGADRITYGAVTGSGTRFLIQSGEITSVNEIAASVEGTTMLNGKVQSIIDIGGQSAKYITDFNGSNKSHTKMSMNTNCSAGTGSFLEEQVSRLNLELEDYSKYIILARSIPRIAGRCSVFAKTDIIHHQQEGVPVEDILLGLAYAVIRNFKGTVMRKLPLHKPIFFIGGVAYNHGIVDALKDTLRLDPEELIVHKYSSATGAIGAAIIASKEQRKINLNQLIDTLNNSKMTDDPDETGTKMLGLASFGSNDSIKKHICKLNYKNNNTQNLWMGVDIGSTSTDIVLINDNSQITAFRYLKTLGDPLKAVEQGFAELYRDFDGKVIINGVGVTGSGRYLIGKLIGADVIRDEISAQARAALAIDPDVDTIFEIGGQDSKYISLKNGIVSDFQMNKICAAGTGSFIEEQANKFNIPIDSFGEIAISSSNPIHLGERCTVFIETSIAANLSKGANIEDIASGLCYAIVKNYLSRVVGQKPIGKKVFFQGGVAHNQGVINAFRALIGDRLSVPPFFSVTGAYGAALMAKEEVSIQTSQFKGLDFQLKKQFLLNRKDKTPTPENKHTFGKRIENLIFAGYTGQVDSNKKTVGIPRALFTFGMFPMFNAFFQELGFNVLLSDPSNEYTIGLGQEYALDETCYPVKLVNGHVAELVQKRVDYIFFPDLYTVDHPGSASRQNFGCAYMQLAFKVLKQSMDLEKFGIELLSPTIAFSLGKSFMMKSFANLGQQLGRTSKQTNLALQKGMQAFGDFEERMEKEAMETIKEIKPDEKVFVLISKIYGVADPILNMGIPETLMNMGYKVIPFFSLPEGDVSNEHPNMFWPFGQHILEPAQLIKEHPNLYAIFLTHHGCGPDSVFSHYFREIMSGKPYLYVEVDEHSSSVGVITRVEAFINSIEKRQTEQAQKINDYSQKIIHHKVRLNKNLGRLQHQSSIYLPYLYPYSEIFREILVQKGVNTKILPRTTKSSIDLGRKFTIAEEYFSLTALLGDVFNLLHSKTGKEKETAFLIPQSEGAEVEGQYSRLLRTKLDEEGFADIDVVSPFIEDFPGFEDMTVKQVFLGLIGGDLILAAPQKSQKQYLAKLLRTIRTGDLELVFLKSIAKELHGELKASPYKKKILVVGEIFVLFNDFLNDFTLADLEKQGYKILYMPLSEYLWMIWQDYADQNPEQVSPDYRCRLDELKSDMNSIDTILAKESHFEAVPDNLSGIANNTVGYYAGGNGRYRAAKMLAESKNFDGIINMFSMYENTGISLNILHKSFENGEGKPILNLTFDGNSNENDKTRVESFIYYL